MKKYGTLLLLLLPAAISCGFGWESDRAGNCAEAKKSAQQLSAVKNDNERKKKEDSILRNCPDGAASRFVTALREERRGKTGRAIDRYREALNLDDTLAEAHGNLGLLLLQKGDAAAAYVELSRGLAGKADPRYHRGLGKIHEKNKKFPEAIDAYREAVKLDPGNLGTHKKLAVLCRKRGMLEEAETEYREILRLRKDDADARNALTAIYFKNKNYNDLFALLKESVELNPEDPISHYRLGVILEFRKEYPAALAEYEKTVALKKGHVKALNAMGRLYLKEGRVDEATKALETVTLSSEQPRYQKVKTTSEKKISKTEGNSKKEVEAKVKSKSKKRVEAKAKSKTKKKVEATAKSKTKKKTENKSKSKAKKSSNGKTKKPAVGQ